MVSNKPKITLQIAHSADGFIARSGERTHLSCEASWAKVYEGRKNVDAIMVGINTILTDNPKLTSHTSPTPIRVVVDTLAGLPPDSHLAQTARDIPVWLLTSEEDPDLERLGVRLIECDVKEDRIDLVDAMSKLAQRGVKTLLCEGGATLAQSLSDERLVDELVLIESNLLLGSGVPLPVLAGYKFLNEEKIDTDTWRYYRRA